MSVSVSAEMVTPTFAALLAKAFSQQARGLKVKLLRLAQGECVEV